MDLYEVLRRPILTEKALTAQEETRTICFEVATAATKAEVKSAVEKLFQVRVSDVRTASFEGKLRRRGRSQGYRPNWKKAYVRLAPGQKVPEFVEV